MTMKTDFSLKLEIAELDSEAQLYSLVASEADREALVERFDLVSLTKLEADVSVRHKGGQQGILIKGQLRASLEQRCIISLASVPETLDVPFELLLVDAEMANRMDEEESYLDPNAPEYDALEGDSVDVGDVVAQTLSISMEPYPKAKGAVVDTPKNPHVSLNEPELEKPNPFAALSKLKDKS
jgi:uncharacterized metal-binding protein YceD (DUF177 family)